MIPRLVIWVFSLAQMVLAAGVVSGQNYPNKPIRIVTSGAGGAADFVARLIAQGLSDPLGQPVIVDNRPEIIAAELVSKAPPDGYTLLAAGGIFMIAPLLVKTSYDTVRDFSPITLMTSSPSVLVVHPSVPVKSVKELIALAKARPGELNYAATAPGSGSQLVAELFKSMAGIKMVGVTYKSAGPGLIDLVGGQVQLMFASASAVAPYVTSGRLRALAVTSAEPSALVPGLPTVAASGLSGFAYATRQGLWAPAKTPATLIARLNQDVVRFLSRADVKERILSTGVEAVPNSPEEFAAYIKSDMAKMGKVIKDAGIRAE